jgi:hypothetical protein
MKIKFLKPAAYLLLLSFGVIFTVTSCEKDPAPMDLPPAESLVIDWSMFPSNTTKSVAEAELNYGNYLFSWGTVVIWNTVVAANIAIPTIAYAAAFNHTPVYLGDNTWEWSYSVTHNQRTIVARLTGSRIDNETFSMEMVLSEAAKFDAFKWFEGVIRYDHTAANWTLSHSPDNPVEYLDIAYEKDFETDVANITYTVIDPQNDLYNGFIDFGIDPELDLDAHYTVSKGDSATYIEWSTSNKMGRVMAEHKFIDVNWHCWDTMLRDVECPVSE